MDIDNARKTLIKMQACFQAHNLPVMGEYERLDLEPPSVHTAFRSCVSDANHLAEVLVFLFLNHNVVQLSMNFYEQLNESRLGDMLKSVNRINFLNAGVYCVLHPKEDKIEFRTAYVLPNDELNEEQFRSMLKNFLDTGLRHYIGLGQLIRNHENRTCLMMGDHIIGP
jgi:hypothetical protein